jgi:hypothetical protein
LGSTSQLEYPGDTRKHYEKTSNDRREEKCHSLGQMSVSTKE